MTGAAEMRRVIAHVSKGIGDALDAESKRTVGPLASTLVALSYARGVLDLLGTYLTDTEPAGVLHLLDGDGSLWASRGEDHWRVLGNASTGPGGATRADIERHWPSVTEVWIR